MTGGTRPEKKQDNSKEGGERFESRQNDARFGKKEGRERTFQETLGRPSVSPKMTRKGDKGEKRDPRPKKNTWKNHGGKKIVCLVVQKKEGDGGVSCVGV